MLTEIYTRRIFYPLIILHDFSAKNVTMLVTYSGYYTQRKAIADILKNSFTGGTFSKPHAKYPTHRALFFDISRFYEYLIILMPLPYSLLLRKAH